MWHGFHDLPHKCPRVMCLMYCKESHFSTECPSWNDMREEWRNRPPERRKESSSVKPPSTPRNQKTITLVAQESVSILNVTGIELAKNRVNINWFTSNLHDLQEEVSNITE